MSELTNGETAVNLDSASQRLAEVFAPWIQQLQLSIEVIEEDRVNTVIAPPYPRTPVYATCHGQRYSRYRAGH